MKNPRWALPNNSRDIAREIFPDWPPLVAELLYNRGLRTSPAAQAFLQPDYQRDVHDPFLFRDMRRVTERLATAIRLQEKIVIHGDYDADGLSATALLQHTLETLGAKVEAFLPHRELDGYGMRAETIALLAAKGAQLIITCDCGISNGPEIAMAHDQGIDVIVTDHHAIPDELPDKAYAILHPKLPGETYPDQGLSGGGVAFKLMQGLLQDPQTQKFLPSHINIEGFQKWQLDLVAIAAVADMVPLMGETRTLVHFGCQVLGKTRRLGLYHLMQRCGLRKNGTTLITPQMIAFQIAPRLNAAGRMEHADIALDLLTTTDPVRAVYLADTLHKHNLERQRLVEQIIKEARAHIIRDQLHQLPALVVAGENWPAGILGLVASRLKEEFYLPTFVVGKNDGRVVGSGRSIDEWNMIAGLQKHPELFTKFGGHPQACGFSLADDAALTRFATVMSQRVAADIGAVDKLQPTLTIEAVVDLEEMNWEVWNLLERFAPFGMGNPEPKFLSPTITLVQATALGTDNKHARLMVRHRSTRLHKLIAFNRGAEAATLSSGQQLDAVFTFGINEWNGQKELQYKIHDFKLCTS